MPRYQTGISIDQDVYEQGKRFAEAQRPTWSFSDLVEIAISKFLASHNQDQQETLIQPAPTPEPTAN